MELTGVASQVELIGCRDHHLRPSMSGDLADQRPYREQTTQKDAEREKSDKDHAKNGIESKDVASVFFSVTADLNAGFPAFAARQLGWVDVPSLCDTEIDVPDSLPRCIRILMNWNTPKSQKEIVHVYIIGVKRLRPDLASHLETCTIPIGSHLG